MTAIFVYENPNVALAARTLLLAGYAIENSRRQPTHIEILCHKTSALASDVRYLVAITEADSFTEHTVQELRRIAGREGRSLVLVGATARAAAWMGGLPRCPWRCCSVVEGAGPGV